jgi:hypothetical protein
MSSLTEEQQLIFNNLIEYQKYLNKNPTSNKLRFIIIIMSDKISDSHIYEIDVNKEYKTKLKNYAAHQDFSFKHTVVLYYVNDADGDTVFFDNDNNIVQSVSPKRGRVVVFDGEIYHGGGIPKIGPRCVVNFDILT